MLTASVETGGVLVRLCGGAEGCAAFFADHFGKRPLRFAGTAAFARPALTEAVCEALWSAPDVDAMLARDGRPWAGRPTIAEARRLFAEGYTWVLRDVDRGDAGLAALGRQLASDVHGTLHLQAYRTPAGGRGFGWHCDPEEVFVVQTEGRKRFLLRENTLHPLPLARAMPTRLSAAHEDTPVQEHLLEPGDCLYIPAGWWHTAEASEPSISLSAGVLAPSLVEVLGKLCAELAREPRWRRRLPPIGRAAPISDGQRLEAWSQSLAELRVELDARLAARDLPAWLYAQTGWWTQQR